MLSHAITLLQLMINDNELIMLTIEAPRQNFWVGKMPDSTPSPLPSLHFAFPCAPFPFVPLEIGPLNTANSLGSAQQSGTEPQRRAISVHLSLKSRRRRLVAMILLIFLLRINKHAGHWCGQMQCGPSNQNAHPADPPCC